MVVFQLSYSTGKSSALLERRLDGSQRQSQWAGEENSPTVSRIALRPSLLNLIKICSVKHAYQWLKGTEINRVMWSESTPSTSQQKCSCYKSAPSLLPQLKSWYVWRRRRRRRTRRRLSAVVMTTLPYSE